jgi:hypothetical protein
MSCVQFGLLFDVLGEDVVRVLLSFVCICIWKKKTCETDGRERSSDRIVLRSGRSKTRNPELLLTPTFFYRLSPSVGQFAFL